MALKKVKRDPASFCERDPKTVSERDPEEDPERGPARGLQWEPYGDYTRDPGKYTRRD